MDDPKGSSLSVPQASWVSLSPLSLRQLGIILVGLSACWISAGSVGLLGTALRHGLVWMLVGGLMVLAWPGRAVWLGRGMAAAAIDWPGSLRRPETLLATAALLLTVILFAADCHPLLNLLAVVVPVAGLASLQEGRPRSILISVALAGLMFCWHRLAMMSIPSYWHLADWASGWLGRLAGYLAGQPLELGATYAGLDFLVLSFAWCLVWGRQMGLFRWKSILAVIMLIFFAHLVYLVGLSWLPILKEKLPPPSPQPEFHVYIPRPWSWSEALKSILPWSFPWVAMAIHLATVGLTARWLGCPQDSSDVVVSSKDWQPLPPSSGKAQKNPQTPWKQIALEAGPLLLTILWGGISLFWGGPRNLAGKKILAYTPHPEAWILPQPDQHTRSEPGAYSMLPELVLSFGGRWRFSAYLTEQELQQTDLLLLVGDAGTLSSQQVAAVCKYVESGGSLLAACGQARPSRIEETLSVPALLANWGLEVQQETAVSPVGQLLEGLWPMCHPAACNIAPQPSPGYYLGLSRSATLKPAFGRGNPILVAQWGYGEPDGQGVRTDLFAQYEAGERLGDLILAAESRVGLGRVCVLASDAWLRNENLPSCYEFVAGLLSYLAHQQGSPADPWRQVFGWVAGLVLVGLVAWRPRPTVLAIIGGVLGLMLLAGWWQSSQASRLLPQLPGKEQLGARLSSAQPTAGVPLALGGSSSLGAGGGELVGPRGLPLAYIDASHMEAYSLEALHPDGLGRLFLTLLQAGYLPLLAPDMKPDRLQTAAVWLSIAPARHFTSAERAALDQYVRHGGTFIAMAGAEDAEPLRPLLASWGLSIRRCPVGPGQTEPEAEPIGESPGPGEHPDHYGRLRTYYLNAKHYGRGDYMVAVTLFAPWPVETISPESQLPVGDADVLVRGYNNAPIVIHRQIGSGSVVLIGDTYFATNKNFDQTDAQPTETTIENAHFWRWMLTRVTHQNEWVPPDPKQWKAMLPSEELPIRPTETKL
ncbi:MAG: GldG family protein [Thermoguttaceae bacterium]|nr:GldG family protein [Thermoguttaceae bacterium]MDW8036599.1 hypothetical protein [Thermoguttaceae bacterium]